MFASVTATAAERAAARPGDAVVAPADVVMDRAFTVPAPPAAVWPWLVQLGKRRAGWYLPHRVERLLPRSHRAIRCLDARWTHLQLGDVVPDYGGRHATFEVAEITAPVSVVYRSQRGRTRLTWSITLSRIDRGTRVSLRLRLAPVRHRRLARTLGEFIDALTVAGMAAGLCERVQTG